jgi:hypothetical protein
MKAMYIERHNAAVRRITSTIMLGRGDAYVVADAGTEDKLPKGVHSTRLPQWLLPSVPHDQLAKMRPDVLLVRSRDSSGATLEGQPETRVVDLIEVGYCSDTRHAEKTSEKTEQHAKLTELLRAAGWTVHYHVVTLGFGGTVPTEALSVMVSTGAPPEAARACLRKLVRHAVASLDHIQGARRALIAAGPHRGPAAGG